MTQSQIEQLNSCRFRADNETPFAFERPLCGAGSTGRRNTLAKTADFAGFSYEITTLITVWLQVRVRANHLRYQ
jgi:hypothetical protein